jgi:hypothetical protein
VGPYTTDTITKQQAPPNWQTGSIPREAGEAMSEQTAANGPAPRRRRLRVIRILGISAILLALLIAAAPWVVAHTGLRDTAINAILASPSVTASSDSASFGWFSPLSVHGLHLNSSNNHVAVRVEDITAERSPWQLLSSAPDLGTIKVDRPHVLLELPLNVQVQGPRGRLEPTFTAIVRDAGLMVRLNEQDEPVIDVDNIDMTCRVEKADEGRVLTLDPTVIFDRRQLSPKLANRLLHLFGPTMSDIPRISGAVSLSLDKLRLPLGVPRDRAVTGMELEGNLVLHEVSTEVSNPMAQALAHLVADMNGKDLATVVRLAQDDQIRFRVRDGRLYHEGLRIGFPDIDPQLQLTSRGSVGLDRTLDLHVELPRLDKALRQAKGPARCHVTGTIANPKIAVQDASLVLRQHDRKEPIIAADGINLTMQVENTATGRVLAVAPVEVFKNKKLSLGVAAGLLKLLAPDVQSDRQVAGAISLSFSKLRMPLGVAVDQEFQQLEAAGRLTLHQLGADVQSPLWQALVKVVADMNGKQPSKVIRLVADAAIDFQVRDGRLYHEGLRIGFPEIDPELVIRSRGSIGIDDNLDLFLQLPRLRQDKHANGPLQCHVTGSLRAPTIAIQDAALVVKLQDGHKAALTADNVNLSFSVDQSKNGPMLTLAPVTVFKKQRLTPEMGDELLHLIVPTLGDLAGVQGEISLSFETFRVPLGVPPRELEKRVELAGNLQLHQVSLSAKTPLLTTLVKVLADRYGKKPSAVVRVVKNADVRFEVRDGRVHHRGLRLGFPDFSPDLLITSRGSVGFDRSLDLVLVVPAILVDEKDLEVRKAPPVHFRVTGSIDKPIVTETKEGQDE